jgi:hypothetical protein
MMLTRDTQNPRVTIPLSLSPQQQIAYNTIIIKNRQEAASTPSAASCRGIPEIYFQIQELYWAFLDFLAFKHKSNLQTRFFPSSLSNSCLKLPQQQ